MKKPLKIAFDASPLLVKRTGIAYYVDNFIRELAQRYPDIELVGFYYNFLGRRPTGHFPQAPNIRYRPVRLIPSKVVYQLRRWGVELPLELLTKERTDFVLFDNFLGYPSLLHTPAAPVVHDLTYLDLPQYVSAKNQRDLERFVPKQIARSSFVLTVSEFSKQKIGHHYRVPADQIVVTPIPPAKPQLYSAAERQETLKKLGITQPFILFLSTIEPRKNIPSLIDAYEKLPKRLQKKYSLIITGMVGWNCEIELARLEQARAQGLNIHHVGYVSDKEKAVLYQTAALYTHTSFYEGFGMPILEAMSYGRPCAISDIPVFHEVAGTAARYWQQDNPEDIARVLQTLLDDPATLKKMGKASRAQAASYDWGTVATRFYDAVRARLDNNGK